MNTITVKAVIDEKGFKEFLNFPYKLFKNDKKWVPSLIMDEKTTFDKKKNPALEFCDFKIFLAYKGSEVVGRIVGMINHKSNEIWKEKRIRFGWLDFINEDIVCQKLLEAVENWGRSEGLTEIVGPMGFTDMDKEGMLVEGFEQDCTMATYYNPSYYPQIIERLSYKKEVDWIQYSIKANQEIPEKFIEQLKETFDKYFTKKDIISVEEIQDIIQKEFIKRNKYEVAESFILYRNRHAEIRENKSDLIKQIQAKLNGTNIENQNANLDEMSFGGRIGEAGRVVCKNEALKMMSKKARKNHEDNIIYVHKKIVA